MNLRVQMLALGILAMPAMAAAASAPIDVVRNFYAHPGLESEPSARTTFVDPALTKLNQNDAIKKTGEGGCLDPGLAFDGPDADPAEIASSLKLAEAVSGDQAKVVAAFTVAQQPHRMEWKLKIVAGEWKVYDLLSVTGEWALSQFGCD